MQEVPPPSAPDPSPESFPTAPPADGAFHSGQNGSALVREISRPLNEVRTWMQFTGLALILLGALSILSLWGILICWIPIWLGVLLIKTAGDIEASHRSGESVSLIEALKRMKTFFIILGVMMALELFMILIGMLVLGGAMFAGLAEL